MWGIKRVRSQHPVSHLGRRLTLLLLLGAVLGFVGSLGLNAIMSWCGLYFNTSQSLPYGLYQAQYRSGVSVGLFDLEFRERELVPMALERGDLVLLCLPPEVAAQALARNYINAGKCPGQAAPVGKYVAAVPGDVVEFSLKGVKVNGVTLPQSAALARDGAGSDMPRPALASPAVVAPGTYWVLNSLASSFDSRYFGPVPDAAIVAHLQPLLTF